MKYKQIMWEELQELAQRKVKWYVFSIY
jgi:hypothetical protein